VPLLPESLRGRAESQDADPFRYLRGVLTFFLGGGAVVALLLALTGLGPKALLLAGLLWTLLGIITGTVDWILEPLIEFGATVLSNVGLRRAVGFSAEESLAAQGHYGVAADAYLQRSHTPGHRVAALLRRADLLAGPLHEPERAVAELEALQRDADRLSPAEDLRLGLALTALYEQRLQDPGRAMVELRRLIERYPDARQTRELRMLLAALRSQHFADTPT